jgi:Tol biopolymer transport system component
MKTFNFLIAILAGTILISCGKKADDAPFKVNSELTPEERSKGLLTPEIMWKFGQVSDPQLSPDGKLIAYSVRHYNLDENKGRSSLYLIASDGESNVQKLTDDNGSDFYPRWSADGSTIRFLSNRAGSIQIFEIAVNVSAKERKLRQISDIEDGITGFEFSPKEDRVLYIKKVKVGKTIEDSYPNLKHVNVRIITDLMYRHWDTWEDGKYSHIFIAHFAFGRLSGEKDINAKEAFDTPMSPSFDMSDTCWSADGKSIFYSSKKLTGKAYAISTNSDIYRYDIENDVTENITIYNKGYDRTPVASPNKQKLAWLSMETDGYESDNNRLMVLNMESGRIEEVTKNTESGAETMCWSTDGNTLYFISGSAPPIRCSSTPMARLRS